MMLLLKRRDLPRKLIIHEFCDEITFHYAFIVKSDYLINSLYPVSIIIFSVGPFLGIIDRSDLYLIFTLD